MQVTYLIDPDTRPVRVAQSDGDRDRAATEPQVRAGHSQGARRQEPRRRLGRHPQPLALADDDLGLPGGQGRLRREAVQPQRPRRPQSRRGGRASTAAIVQHGTQQRSSQRAGQRDRGRPVGQVRQAAGLARATAASRAGASASSRSTTPPAELDFNLWLGPAPEQPYHANLVHYNWHWFWDFGNGDIGNQGVHEMDVARWAIKEPTLPKSVWSLGGRFGYEDQGQTPNTQMAVYRLTATRCWSSRSAAWSDEQGARTARSKVANEYYTTEGRDRGRQVLSQRQRRRPRSSPRSEVKVTPGGAFGSFLQAVRSRKPEDLNANAETAHYSAALCHLANISYRLGEQVPLRQGQGHAGRQQAGRRDVREPAREPQGDRR